MVTFHQRKVTEEYISNERPVSLRIENNVEFLTFTFSSFFERPKKEAKKSSAHDDFATTLISCISRDPSRSGCLAFCKVYGFFRAGTSGSLTMPTAHDASKCVVSKTVEGGASKEDFSFVEN